MWKDFITLSENKKSVVAQLPAGKEIDKTFSAAGLAEALAEIGARKYRVLDDSVTRFINCARELKGEAYEGIVVAEMRNAVVEVVLSEQDMLASMVVTGAYGGRGLHGSELVHALAQSHVIKGINKLALKKVLLMSNTLKPGEIFTQPWRKAKKPCRGRMLSLFRWWMM